MRLRRLIAGIGSGLVGLAATNTVLRDRAGALGPPLQEAPSSIRWRGIDVSLTAAGDPDDPDLVLLHGIGLARTSREFRALIADLAESFHVLAPDYPGYGRSERPPLLYSARLYEDFVTEFIRDYADKPVCLAIGLSGAYALSAASDCDVRQLLLVTPTDRARGPTHPALRSLIRLPVLGDGVMNLCTSRLGLRYAHSRQFHDLGALTSSDLQYEWRSAHQPGARFAPASYLGGYLDAQGDLGSAMSAVDAPSTLIWGRDAEHPPLSRGRRLAERGECKLVVIDQAGAVPHIEQPAAFTETLRDELTA